MKHLLLIPIAMLINTVCGAQITITASDMPVAGDTFIYSNASVTGTAISPADSGTNKVWNYPLTATSQGMDVYLTPAEVSPLLAFSLPTGLYGYQTTDSIPDVSLLIPGVTIHNLYTYFKKTDTPSSFEAAAFSATISGFAIGTSYSKPDIWYLFPLTYGNSDSNNYELNISLLTYGTLKETGYRKTRVDGWGTITTPYYTTPVDCIRVRSVINETDSIPLGSTTIGIPNNTVQYVWLDKTDHNPALWVTSNVIAGMETITSVKYRDRNMPTSVSNAQRENINVTAYPNPARNGIVTLKLPQDWQTYHVDVFDIQSRTVVSQNNERVIDMQSLPEGNYVARILCGTKTAFVQIVK